MTTSSLTIDQLPAAALWDFDGTLIDTEPVWMRSEFALTEELGGVWTDELAHQVVGNALIDTGATIRRVARRDDLTDAEVTERLVDKVVATLEIEQIAWRPGARELLADLEANRIPCALVTASFRRLVDTVLGRLDHDPFAVIVAGDDVTHGKPHPEAYLTACLRLGVDPQDCLVLEDSPTGAAAGNAAGCVVGAVPNVVPVPRAPRRFHLDTLAGVSTEGLRNLMSEELVG